MVQDLCIIMLTAGASSLLFKLLRQPVVLGYIVAGILVGPHVLGGSWLSNSESVDTWGQIGVLFLLFAMGLEFSYKKLLQVGSTALIAAGVIVVGMMGSGFCVGRLLGLNEINALFLGGMLSMSSTTIVFKALDDMGLRDHNFARICFGILVVEDLFAVVLMVVLSSIATSRSFEGLELVKEVGKLIVYIVLWFVLAMTLIPPFLKNFKKHLNDETLTILSVGLCLGMVLLATGAGFSSALGAFFMGSVLAETIEAERIEHLVEPVKNIFGSIFFVSVGMMINPSQLVEYAVPILILTALVLVGQTFFGTFGTLLSGQSLRVSVQTGFSLTQVGEFAFIIASLGLTLRVTDESLYPIVVAVSVITTFLTPFSIRASDPAFRWLDRHMSEGVKLFLQHYASNRNTVSHRTTFQSLLRKVLLSLFVYGILLSFLYLLMFNTVNPWMRNVLPEAIPTWAVNIIELVVLLLVASPLLYAMATAHRRSPESRDLWRSGNYQKAQLIGISLLRTIVCVAFVAYGIYRMFSLTWGVVTGVAILLVILILLSRQVRLGSQRLLSQFSQNLSAREDSKWEKRTISRQFSDSLLSYDVHLAEFTLPANSSLCGHSLAQTNIRAKSGVSVVCIVRGGISINIPGGTAVIYPGDHFVVAGSDDQIEQFKRLISSSQRPLDETADIDRRHHHVTLERYCVGADSSLVGVSILHSHIREEAHCIVMVIERDGKLIANPESSEIFQQGDIITLAGETESIRRFVTGNM